MERKNIGSLTRALIKRLLGTDKGQAVIDIVEAGYLPALTCLVRGDLRGFLELLPAEAADALLKLGMKAAIEEGLVAYVTKEAAANPLGEAERRAAAALATKIETLEIK